MPAMRLVTEPTSTSDCRRAQPEAPVRGSIAAPTISVVIPCYNGAAFLRGAIESALGQTKAPFEIIVVDDGSTDRSAEVATTFGSKIQLIRQANRGESGARNTGAAHATGSHVFFLDADDLIAAEALEVLSEAACDNSTAVILMGSAAFVDDPRNPTSISVPTDTAFFPGLVQDCLGVPHSWLTPRAVYARTTGFAPSRNYFVDWEFWCRIALLRPPLIVLPYVGALYRRHPASMSATTPSTARARGHVAVMETLATGFLAQRQLLNDYCEHAFLGSDVAIRRARSLGVSWSDLKGLGGAMRQMAEVGPVSVRNTRLAVLVRRLGVRTAYSLRQLFRQT
jgi:hypothetical protein